MKFILSLAMSTFVVLDAFQANADERKMTVYKTPTCGCCALWVDHVKAAGFHVEVHDMNDLSAIKQMAGVPNEMQACHTAVVDGHTVEGHVPAHAIERFLASAKDGQGIAVPGMPQGSPGMPSPMPDIYDVMAFGGGERSVIGRYKRDQPVE